MKTVLFATLILLAELRGIIALPAASVTSITPTSATKPESTIDPPCLVRCIEGYHSFFDPKTRNCGCIPYVKEESEEQKCLHNTICVEYDTPMIPTWDQGTKKCSCKPKQDVGTRCLASTTCSVESTPSWDPKTRKCRCTPNLTDEQTCIKETICVETDVPMVPDWDNVSKTCICKPRSDEEFICIAATTCLPGSSPYWDRKNKKCNCLKTKPSSDTVKRDLVARSLPSPTVSPIPLPTPSVDHCTYLKIFCEFGDHHMHWSQEKQGCECPSGGPVVNLRCEGLKIYCGDGDHHSHWDPITKICQCPAPESLDPETQVKRDHTEVIPQNGLTSTSPPAPTLTSRVDTCPLLRKYCPCQDHHFHWNEELQECACQPCQPPKGVVCENYEVYCAGGDHKMHWDSLTAKCQCLIPQATDYAPEPLQTI